MTDSTTRLSDRYWTACARERDDGEVDVALKNAGTALDNTDAEWTHDTVAVV